MKRLLDHLNLDRSAISWRAYALLLLFGLFSFLPGFTSLPPVDRDEPRYAQASKQMIESDNYRDIYFQQEPRYKKPVGIYWLQSTSARLFGTPPYDDIWPYRLPSLLGGLLALCLTAWGVARLSNARTGLLAAAMLASTMQLHFESRIGKTDAALLACIVGAQFILARAYLERTPLSARLAYGFWIFQAIGILIKGPIAPLVSGLTLGALWLTDRKITWAHHLRPRSGLLLCAVLVLPWLVWIGIASHGKFYGESVSHDLLGKILQGQDRGSLPPGYHSLLLGVLFLPQISLLLAAVRNALFPPPLEGGAGGGVLSTQGEPMRFDRIQSLLHFFKKLSFQNKPLPQPLPQGEGRINATRFALAWIIPLWILYELILTKLPHYVLPAYPALAWLAASQAMNLAMPEGRFWCVMVRVQAAALCLAFIGMMTASIFLEQPSFLLFTMGSFGIACAIAQARLTWRLPPMASLCGISAGTFLWAGLLGGVAPLSAPLWLSPQINAFYQDNRPCPFSRLITSGYTEPSLVFMAGTRTLFANGAPYAASLITQDACAVVLIRDKQDADFQLALTIFGGRAIPIGHIRGFNYNGGGWQNFTFYRAPPFGWPGFNDSLNTLTEQTLWPTAFRPLRLWKIP